jgi:protein-S-isoprenylcysteine O-methyltransferase Ste14
MSKLASTLFKYRSYTPIPLLVVMLIFHEATPASLITGFAVSIVGELIRFWGVSWAGSETRTTSEVGGSNLVISGPFAYVRNPLYIGNILIYLGLGIMSFALFPYLQIAALLFFVFQYHFIIKEEENYLHKTYGSFYVEYVKNVPRLLPRFTPYKNSEIEQPAYKPKNGLRSEKRTLQALILISAGIITLWIINNKIV